MQLLCVETMPIGETVLRGADNKFVEYSSLFRNSTENYFYYTEIVKQKRENLDEGFVSQRV